MLGVGASAVANAFSLGAALLALWLVCCYPRLGPGSLQRGFLLVACASILLFLVAPATAVVKAAAGTAAALLFVVLPMLTFVFWAAAHLLRLYVARAAGHSA